jgi:pimeloyl-ACP methyl ester carboxylesterase
MATYVDLDGVRTWYDEHGTGEPVVLMHPGGADAQAFGPNLDAFTARFRTFLPERRGHGHTPDREGPYSYSLVADDMIRFMEQVVGGPAKLVGCSDGAVVALHVALKRPDLVPQLICAAGVFHWHGWVPSAIDPGTEELTPFLAKLHHMHTTGPTLTPADLNSLQCRTLVMIGDDDEVVFEHAIEFYRALPQGELAIVPGTSHGLLVEKPDLCNKIMLDFLTLDAVETFAPIRRK